MSGYPNQPNQHQLQQQQHQQMMYQQQQDPMMMASQQGNSGMNPSIQMNYGVGAMGQSKDSFMHHQQYPQMGATPSGMPPHVYNSLNPSLSARSPYNMGGGHGMGSSMGGGPHSIPPPGSVNPLSVPQQQGGPGSVGPHSVPPPGSVQGPASISGPHSIPQPTSMLGMGGPGSVPLASNDSMGGGGLLSVPMGGVHSNQGPSPSSLGMASHMGPSPLVDGQGRSPLPPSSMGSALAHQGSSPSLHNPLSHGGPQSVSLNPSTPHNASSVQPPSSADPSTSKPTKQGEEFNGIFIDDPMKLSKLLIAKDLRTSFFEMNRSMGDLLKNRDNLTGAQSEKYTRDYNEFMAVCDQVEQALTMVMETSKMMSKLDRSYTPDGGNPSGRTNEYTLQPLINYVDETDNMSGKVEKTVGGVFEMMSKIRKREALFKDMQKEMSEDVKMETEKNE